jgi:hypothetical protein
VKQAERIAKFEAERRQQDLKMMQSPDDWPRWPLLPIKKPIKGQFPDTAVLFADGTATVIWVNPFTLSERPGTTWAEKFDGAKKQAYVSFEAMIDDGWRVD